MSANLLDGKVVSESIKQKVAAEISQRLSKGFPAPELAVIMVGSDPASQVYVTHKRRACAQVGILSHAYDLPENTTEAALLQLISELNDNRKISGILVQLPLPAHIDSLRILEAISPDKDVDGFHPYNVGLLSIANSLLPPCTPAGIIALLEYYKIALKGLDVVIVGASNIVGKPLAMELLQAGSTVSICHRYTKDLASYVALGDLIVVAIGKRNVIKTEWIKPGAIVVDVGIHRLENHTICGDIDFESAKEKASWITPVPGGVGPMTVAILLQNTLTAASNLY